MDAWRSPRGVLNDHSEDQFLNLPTRAREANQRSEAEAEVKLSLPQILGNVIAHELGHLLLGANSHTPQGLMRAHWSRDQLLATDLSQLRFSDQQCRQIRNSVATRSQRTWRVTSNTATSFPLPSIGL